MLLKKITDFLCILRQFLEKTVEGDYKIELKNPMFREKALLLTFTCFHICKIQQEK